MKNSNHKSIFKIILVPIVSLFVGILIAVPFFIVAGFLPGIIFAQQKGMYVYVLHETLFIVNISLISSLLGYLIKILWPKSFPKWAIFLTIPLILPAIFLLLLFAAIVDSPYPEMASRIFWVLAPLPFYLLGLIIHYHKE